MRTHRCTRRTLLQALLGGALLSGAGRSRALDELQHLPHLHLGQVSLLLPEGWRIATRTEAASGTLFITVQPPQAGWFDLELAVNELSRFRNEALASRDMTAWLNAALAGALPQSAEGRITPQPFGLRREEARYARLTDKAPPPGEFRFVTMGARLNGPRATLFTLYANDADGAVLKRVLDFVASFTFEP
jgi:hypothetical protein